MHAPDRPHHVAPLLLALEGMAGSLEELHVAVAADHGVQRAVCRGVHEEPDVARVEPVVAARDDDPRRAGGRRAGLRDGEAGAIPAGHEPELHGAGLRGRPERRLHLLLAGSDRRAGVREGVQRPWSTGKRPVHQLHRRHPAERLGEEQPFGGGERGRRARELGDERIGRHADVEPAPARGFLEEPHIVGPEVVQARLDHDAGGPRGHAAHARTAIRDEPAGGVSDATTRYPPPHPEYIAPACSAA